MELNDLKIFSRVASEQSISKAALDLGYAQSNISMRIKVLEEELKTKLFNRTSKGSELTSDGIKLLVYVNQINTVIDKINGEFLTPSISRIIKIGAPQTMLASLLPRAIAGFKARFYDIQFSLFTLKSDRVLESLNSNEIDIAFLYDNDLREHTMIGQIEEEAVLIYPVKHQAQSIGHLSMIVNSDASCPYRKIAMDWVKTNQGDDKDILYFDTLESIINSVRAGIGISVIPKSLVNNYQGIESQIIHEVNSAIKIAIVIPKNRTNTEMNMNFVETIIEESKL